MSAIDDYLDGLAPEQKAALARVRVIVAELVPDAEEGRSYGMPAPTPALPARDSAWARTATRGGHDALPREMVRYAA